jgi:hypothetical protein
MLGHYSITATTLFVRSMSSHYGCGANLPYILLDFFSLPVSERIKKMEVMNTIAIDFIISISKHPSTLTSD